MKNNEIGGFILGLNWLCFGFVRAGKANYHRPYQCIRSRSPPKNTKITKQTEPNHGKIRMLSTGRSLQNASRR